MLEVLTPQINSLMHRQLLSSKAVQNVGRFHSFLQCFLHTPSGSLSISQEQVAIRL